jgi:hypothetical protein
MKNLYFRLTSINFAIATLIYIGTLIAYGLIPTSFAAPRAVLGKVALAELGLLGLILFDASYQQNGVFDFSVNLQPFVLNQH